MAVVLPEMKRSCNYWALSNSYPIVDDRLTISSARFIFALFSATNFSTTLSESLVTGAAIALLPPLAL